MVPEKFRTFHTTGGDFPLNLLSLLQLVGGPGVHRTPKGASLPLKRGPQKHKMLIR